MMFKRPERRRHPLCTMAVCAMTAVGACAMVSLVKEKMCEMTDMAKTMFKKKKKCPAQTACEKRSSSSRCPVCGEPTE